MSASEHMHVLSLLHLYYTVQTCSLLWEVMLYVSKCNYSGMVEPLWNLVWRKQIDSKWIKIPN